MAESPRLYPKLTPEQIDRVLVELRIEMDVGNLRPVRQEDANGGDGRG